MISLDRFVVSLLAMTAGLHLSPHPPSLFDAEHDAWKAGVMSGAITLEEIDTAAFTDRYGKLALSVGLPKQAPAAAE